MSFAIQDADLNENLTLELASKLRIAPRYYFNIDAVSSIIGGNSKVKVHLAPHSKSKLKEMKLSPAHQAEPRGNYKMRGVKQYYMTSADGFLKSAIIVIRDEHISTIRYKELVRYDGGYDLWLVLMPKEHKKLIKRSTNKVCEIFCCYSDKFRFQLIFV